MQAFEVFGEIALKGVDAVTSGVDRAGNAAEGLGRDFQGVARKTDRLADNLGDLGRTLSTKVTGPAAAAGAAIAAIGSSGGQAAQEIKRMAAATGLSVEQQQKWNYVASQMGMQEDAILGVMEHLNSSMKDVREGTGEVGEAVAEMGLNVSALSEASADKRFKMLLNRIRQYEDPTKRAQMATRVFAGDIKEIAPLLNLTAKELQNMEESGEKFAVSEAVLDEAEDTKQGLNDLGSAFNNFQKRFSAAIAPVVDGPFGDALENLVMGAINAAIGALEALVAAFTALPEPIQLVIGGLAGLAGALGPIAMAASALMKFKSVQAVFLTLSTVTRTLAAGFRILTVAMMTNPVIFAIVAAVTAAILVFKNWEKIVEVVSETFDAAMSAISKAVEGATGAVENALQSAWSWVKNKGDAIKNYLTGLVEDAKQAFQDAWDWVTGAEEAGQEARNVTSNLTRSGGEEGRGGRAGQLTEKSGGDTYVDMRGATIKDGKDLDERVRRSGSSNLGGLA